MYTITAQAEGYLPFSTSDIAITTDTTTTLDIALQPCHLQEVDFTYSPPDPLSGQPVSFTASVGITSTLPVTYTWDFGDGHSGSGQETTHTYTLGGTYPVTLSAENCASILTATHPVIVESVPGINLSAQAFDFDAAYGQTLTQILEIGNSGETALTWSLLEQPEVPWLAESVTSGDLDPQQRQEITLTLQAPLAHGIYTTTLQVISNDPDQPQTDIPVTLQVACASVTGVDFTYSPAAPRIGQEVAFTSQVMASLPITYTWSFQDGSPEQSGQELASVAHAFPVSPIDQAYPVTLSAYNACSEPMQVENIVLVSAYKAFLPVLPAQAP
jgi:PKD repeat protein